MMSAVLIALRVIGIKLVTAFASEKFLEWLLFWVAQKIVDSTKTPQDDEFLAKLREAYGLTGPTNPYGKKISEAL